MRRTWPNAVLFSLLLALAGCGGDAGGECSMPLAAVIPMSTSQNGERLTMPARVAGRDLNLLLDTGADTNMISAAAVPGKHQLLGWRRLSGVGTADVNTGVISLEQVEFGRLHGGITADVAPKTFSTLDGHRVDGLIGMGLLGAYDVDIDQADHQLRLYAPSGDCGTAHAVLDPPLYLVHEPVSDRRRLKVMVPVTIGGKDFTAQIDTGAPYTLLFSPAWHALGFTAAELAREPSGNSVGLGGAVRAHVHVLDEIDIGALGLRHVPVAMVEQSLYFEGGPDLILGMDFIRRVHIWISNSARAVVFQFPPGASPPLPAGLH